MNQPYPNQYPAQPPAPKPKKKRLGLKILLGVVAAFVVIAIAVPSSPKTPAAPVVPVGTSAAQTTQAPEATAAPAPEVAAGPLTTVSDGTYEVGVDMVAGKYKGQCDTNAYWARLKSDNGTDYIANDWKPDGGLMQFTAKKGEYVEVKNCTFTRQG